MTRVGFQKSVRMFRKFSEETLRRRGGDPLGRDGVAALSAIEAVLAGQRLLDGSLLEPLAAFTNLLQSAQLPPEFGDYSFGDALLAVEDAHAELRQNDEQRWEFSTELAPDRRILLDDFARTEREPSSDSEHVRQLRDCVLSAAGRAEPGCALVIGALACPDLPLRELVTRFQLVRLSDLDLPALDAHVRRALPESLRARVRLESYDPTGSYLEFAERAGATVEQAAQPAEAESALAALLQSYDVGAGSAGLSAADDKVDLAVSALLLSELGSGYAPCVARKLERRGWDGACCRRAPLAPAFELLSRLVEQHHIHALLRRAASAVLISAVSEVALDEHGQAAREPVDLLGVQRLAERLPKAAALEAEHSWEWRSSARSVSLVEAAFMTLDSRRAAGARPSA